MCETMSEIRRNLLKGGGKVRLPELPEWARESVVCWYSPKYQGATNATLGADGLLTDLSGNGHDMKLAEMNAERILAKGGALDPRNRFETIDRIGALEDFTVIWHGREMRPTGSFPNLFVKGRALRLWSWGGWVLESFGQRNVSTGKPWQHVMPEFGYVTPVTVWGYEAARGSVKDVESVLTMGGNGYLPGSRIYSVIVFDRTLTDGEREWIIKNVIN